VHTVGELFPEKNIHVLDFGCGRGEVIRLLRRAGYAAFGCDVFYEGGSAKEDVSDLITRGIVCNMPDGLTPYGSDRFDMVIANQVFEHVPHLEKSLSEIHRILKPGGVLLSLFPDRGVWREGHCGIPFLHRFPKGSPIRLWYAVGLRSLGMGTFKGEKGIVEWSKNFCNWLDKWTYYRDRKEIRETFHRYFVDLASREPHWLDTRFGAAMPFVQAIPQPMKRFIVAKWGGMIFTARKATSPSGQ